MRLAGLVQDQCDTLSTDGLMPQRKQIAQSQTAGIADSDPGWQQHAVLAGQRTPRHIRCHRKQQPKLAVSPRPDNRKEVLDTANRPCTLVHQQTLSDCGTAQCPEHASVVVYGGGREAMKSSSQIGVDVRDRQVDDVPVHLAGQNDQLLPIPLRGSASQGVGLSVGNEGDGASSVRGLCGGELRDSTGFSGRWNTLRKIATLGHSAPLAQLDRIGGNGWDMRPSREGRSTILGALLFLATSAADLAGTLGELATLVLLGHFRSARSRWSRYRSPRPRLEAGPFPQEVNK